MQDTAQPALLTCVCWECMLDFDCQAHAILQDQWPAWKGCQRSLGEQDASILKLGVDDVQALQVEADLAVQQGFPAPAAGSWANAHAATSDV